MDRGEDEGGEVEREREQCGLISTNRACHHSFATPLSPPPLLLSQSSKEGSLQIPPGLIARSLQAVSLHYGVPSLRATVPLSSHKGEESELAACGRGGGKEGRDRRGEASCYMQWGSLRDSGMEVVGEDEESLEGVWDRQGESRWDR